MLSREREYKGAITAPTNTTMAKHKRPTYEYRKTDPCTDPEFLTCIQGSDNTTYHVMKNGDVWIMAAMDPNAYEDDGDIYVKLPFNDTECGYKLSKLPDFAVVLDDCAKQFPEYDAIQY